MTRKQGINLVKLYDGQYPKEFIETYLDYYRMHKTDFDTILDKWVNQELFEKVDGIWQPLFKII